MARYHVAVNTVERAIKELRDAGVVETAQGAGMFVREPPDISLPTGQRLEKLESEVAHLRELVNVLHAQLIELYHSQGQPYPYDEGAIRPGRQVG
jgi:DNA-binding transcriptional regulator YhcF (GntR family)